MNNQNSRSFTVTCKVTAEEKSKYIKEAKEVGIPLSEFVASILSQYYKGYFENVISSKKELELTEKIGGLKNEIKNQNYEIDLLKREAERHKNRRSVYRNS